jgi:D-glycero-D-manno-heptose 1,7-bisphosphate phosphatase
MRRRKPALFLDRDGIVNKNYGYVYKKDDFDFHPEIFEICKIAQNAEMPIIIVTNQSGIGRGYFSEEDFLSLTNWMVAEFQLKGIAIDMVLYAPESPDKESEPERRKPSPEMILEAAEEFNINLTESIFIGDKESDMLAAQRSEIRHRILITNEVGSNVASMVVANHLQCIGVVSKVVARSQG